MIEKQFQVKTLYEIKKKHPISMEIMTFEVNSKYYTKSNILKIVG